MLVFGFGAEAFLNEFCRRMQIFLDFGSLTRVSRVSSLDSFRPWHRHSGFLVGQTLNYIFMFMLPEQVQTLGAFKKMQEKVAVR